MAFPRKLDDFMIWMGVLTANSSNGRISRTGYKICSFRFLRDIRVQEILVFEKTRMEVAVQLSTLSWRRIIVLQTESPLQFGLENLLR